MAQASFEPGTSLSRVVRSGVVRASLARLSLTTSFTPHAHFQGCKLNKFRLSSEKRPQTFGEIYASISREHVLRVRKSREECGAVLHEKLQIFRRKCLIFGRRKGTGGDGGEGTITSSMNHIFPENLPRSSFENFLSYS